MKNKNFKPTGKRGSYGAKGNRGAKRDKRLSNSMPNDDRGEERVCAGSKPNDPAWYSLNEQLLRDTASFPYSWPLGNRLNLGNHTPKLNRGSVPGVMSMYWIPTVGNSTDSTSAINVASINVYTKVRHDNSGHANYDHTDYMMYLLAMDSVYAFHSWMRRVYGTALTYSNTNRYYPRGILSAMGVEFGNIQANLADFRAYINEYAVKASALAVPAKMSYMTKHYWMSEGLYYDSDQDKPQTYLFNPLGFYKFGYDASSAGKLDFVPLYGTRDLNGHRVPASPVKSFNEVGDAPAALNFSDIRAYGDALLKPIISDEDFGIMSGDTLKSFGIGGCYTLPFTQETYTVLPSYVPEVLDQIQNATFIGLPDIDTCSITQNLSDLPNTGHLITQPNFTHPWIGSTNTSEMPGQNAFCSDRFLNFMHGNVTPANTMEASRWTNIGTEVTKDRTEGYLVPTMGSEVMCCARIWNYAVGSTSQQFELHSTPEIYVSMNLDVYAQWEDPIDVSTADGVKSAILKVTQRAYSVLNNFQETIQMVGVFDRHPYLMLSGYFGFDGNVFSDTITSTTIRDDEYVTVNGVMGDINYYTILNARDIENMSHIALLSEFDVTMR